MKQNFDTNEATQVRQWFMWHVERQQMIRLYNRPMKTDFKLFHNRNVVNDF